jgi:hypothetical protein
MTTSTNRKINLNDCIHKELFKATALIEAKLAKTYVL